MSWPTGAFWYCLASSTMVSWQQFCHIGQLHRVFSSHFLQHWFSYAVMFRAVSLLSHKLVTQMKLFSVFDLGLPAQLLVLFCLVSWYLLTVLSTVVLKKKNTFKSIFQKISGYAEVKITEEDLDFSIINENIARFV